MYCLVRSDRSSRDFLVWLGYFNQVLLCEIQGCWKAVTTSSAQKDEMLVKIHQREAVAVLFR